MDEVAIPKSEVGSEALANSAHQGVSNGAEVFGTLVSILARAPAHRHLFLADLDWFLAPALALKQLRIFHDGKQAIGFAIWASVSEEIEKELLNQGQRLRPGDWNSGDRLWLMELVLLVAAPPPKLVEGLLAELAKGPFSGKRFKLRLVDAKTGKPRVVELGPKSTEQELGAAASEKATEVGRPGGVE
jgi:cytolysin-activating lysine-acyltransferase